jgi:aminopeptidase YwaD
MEEHPSISEGVQWVQGDHSIFVQFGVPAIAVSSQWFLDNMATQDITHTPKDNPSIVDLNKIVEIAEAISEIIKKA